MKALIAAQRQLVKEGRWDFDYHSPAELICSFPTEIIKPVIEVAEIVKDKRDPTRHPDAMFQYIDISSVDVGVGGIARSQELTGAEAPSRARKLVRGYDIIISTCRPTRGAIAVVPEELHGEICSTGFSVIRVRDGINPYYLHYAIRLQSTMEQFRKFSTGSSYPAILDSDVEKTRIPVPSPEEQDKIVRVIRLALYERKKVIEAANKKWFEENEKTLNAIRLNTFEGFSAGEGGGEDIVWKLDQIKERISGLPELTPNGISDDLELDFDIPDIEIEEA
jgi:hypothetical protein